MKIIDLLNKIANGEIPPKIKHNDTTYTYDSYGGEYGYVDKTKTPYKWFEKVIDCDIKEDLNDTVEILEEEKKIPEKLPKSVTDNACSSKDMRLIANTLNQVIDYLESKGE